MALEEVLEVFQGVLFENTVIMIQIILDVFLGDWEMNKKDDLGFVAIKLFFITTVQEFNHMHCILVADVKGLR